jgi:hypothetical protein
MTGTLFLLFRQPSLASLASQLEANIIKELTEIGSNLLIDSLGVVPDQFLNNRLGNPCIFE